ncbi:MAG: hypothetical protein LC117_06895 [Bacteroidia bacterium]|nr:hypothetical protein [Bacteroidia bacterium]MCZ2277637.1 hypothetical protein [Bacteroidia bacterium]
MKRILLLTAFSVLVFPFSAYSQAIPVILRINSQDQHDTLGYNLVTALTSEVYNLINSQQVKLWDSPEKEIYINASSVHQIERASGVSFLSQSVIFIYERWEKTRSGINSQTIGMKFSALDEKNQEVSFGFLDYNDVSNHFMRARLPVNANGNYETSFAYVLLKKQYAFNLLQFGPKTITSGGTARELLADYMNNLIFNPTITAPEYSEKLIDYHIDFSRSPSDEKAGNANKLLAAIELFLQNNEEIFYNLGGDKILNYFRKGKIRVTCMEVKEFWKNYNNQISTDTKNIQIYVNDSTLSPVSFSDFLMWGIQIGDESMHEVFKDKNFAFTIRRINEMDIPKKNAHLYLKALYSIEWNKITEFVKYY